MVIHLIFVYCGHSFTKLVSVDSVLLHMPLIIGPRMKVLVNKGIQGDEKIVQKIEKGSRQI